MVIEFQKAEDVKPADFKPHPLAELFPMMDDDAFLDFAQDIEKSGQREPIIIYENKILDGRNRYKACQMLGFSPRFKEYNGNDALGFVISLNLKRRHLTESQRSMVAGKLSHWKTGTNQHTAGGANLPAHKAAEMLNVSERSVKTARQVQKSGVPELVKAVEEGAVSVSAAAVIAKQPPEKQAEILSPKDEKVIASAVKELKEAQNLYDRTVAAKEAYGSPEPLTKEDMEALADAVGTPAERSVVMSVLGIGKQVAELPPPSVFIDQIPPAFERTINDEINSLEGVLNWFDAFLKAWKAKE